MAKIEWRQSLSVNNDELDNQHKKLFFFYNRLHESLLNGSVEETIKTKLTTLNDLAEYASYHFKAEELFMQKMSYADINEHRLRHQQFTTRITSLLEDVKNNRVILSTSLIKFLRNWIVEHIAKEDQEYTAFFKK